jgi:hypothetical protein
MDCECDVCMGIVTKKRRLNPIGEDMYLEGESIIKDEDKITRIQRIFKHNYYKPGGSWYLKKSASFQTEVNLVKNE